MDASLCRPAVLGPAVLIVGLILYHLLRPSRLPDIPVVGAKPGEWFPLLRARWRNLRDPKAACKLAYTEYRNQACIVPVFSARDFVHLPLDELQWLLNEPDHSVNALELAKDNLETRLTIMDPELMQKPVHNSLVSTLLTRETGNLIPNLYDEIEHSISELWGGRSGETREVCVYASTQRIIGRVTNRVFVGLPLCRNDALLDNGIAFAQDIPLASALLKFVWRPLRPLAALLVTLPNRLHTHRFYKVLRPEIEKRLRQYDIAHANPETKAMAEEPNDFLQWSVHQAKASQDPYLAKPDTLAGRILIMNFASIHTSSFAISHVLFDLASSSPAYIEALRVEIATALAEHGGRWNKGAIAAMHKLDSTMRESQRVNSFVPLATNRLVTNPKGLTTPSGLHIPAGAAVCGPAYAVMHDEAIYEDAEAFRPFRFAERRRDDDDEGSYVKKARQAWATTSLEYTAFGHGRHSCPGRFFASSELKLMLAYILMNYEFEMLETRPKNAWFGMNRLPPMKATLRIRRRDT